jgi:hypothetical protein
MLLGVSPHDLTQMPAVLGISTPLGLVLGAVVAFFWRASSDAALVQNIVAGATLGSVVGAILGFALSFAAIVAGA